MYYMFSFVVFFAFSTSGGGAMLNEEIILSRILPMIKSVSGAGVGDTSAQPNKRETPYEDVALGSSDQDFPNTLLRFQFLASNAFACIVSTGTDIVVRLTYRRASTGQITIIQPTSYVDLMATFASFETHSATNAEADSATSRFLKANNAVVLKQATMAYRVIAVYAILEQPIGAADDVSCALIPTSFPNIPREYTASIYSYSKNAIVESEQSSNIARQRNKEIDNIRQQDAATDERFADDQLPPMPLAPTIPTDTDDTNSLIKKMEQHNAAFARDSAAMIHHMDDSFRRDVSYNGSGSKINKDVVQYACIAVGLLVATLVAAFIIYNRRRIAARVTGYERNHSGDDTVAIIPNNA